MSDAFPADCSSSTMAGYGSPNQYYDVFINHRGPDVKDTFATSLYRRLTSSGLQVFLDRPEMQIGHDISSQIEAAIQVASVHVAVFSPLYAESKWCLNELLSMVKSGKTIIPVFYEVKPEHLRWTGRDKNGPYAEALCKHEEKQRHGIQTIQQWRKALSDVANISGLELEAFNGDEEKVIQSEKLLVKVVQRVLEICPPRLDVAKYATGLAGKFEELERTVLSEQQRENRVGAKVVGIVGLGGIGKTTLARYFFNLKRSDYQVRSFLFDVKENADKMGLNYLQSKLIKELKHQEIVIERCEEGKEKLETNLLSCHALVILDDIDHIDQLDAFLSIKDSLDRNSLILVTSRDRGVLKSAGITESSIYHLRCLTRAHSQQLFCSYAFLQRDPLPGFENLVDGFIKACDGLPLSLKVLGALLCGQNEISYWAELLDGLNKLPADIENRLRSSYNSLNGEEQQIFLDIACFCIGDDRDRWIRIWAGTGWKGLVGFRNLENKCLVEVDSENRIMMHDHLRDLGRHIAESPGSMSPRLWHSINNLQDINDQLEQSSMGITEVRGIKMTNWNIKSSAGDIQKCSPVLRGKKLQLLEAGGNAVERILKSVQPRELIWLCWHDCHDSFLPSWIPMHHLRVLELHSQRLKGLWTSKSQGPVQLRELVIHAPVVKLPKSLSQLEHLEKLVVESKHLTALSEDFYLPSLKYLEIYCPKLQRLWKSDSNAPLQLRELTIHAPLEEFPLRQLKLLEKLVACNMRLTELPEDFYLPSLKYLKIESSLLRRLWRSDSRAPLLLRELIIYAPLVEFPRSLEQLKYLEKVVAEDILIERFPGNFYLPSLKYLHLRSDKLQRLWQCDSQAPLELRVLILYAPNVREFPESLRQLKNLELLAANGISLTPEFCYLPSLKYLLLQQFELKIFPNFEGALSKLKDEDDWEYRILGTSRCMFEGSICSLAHLQRIVLHQYSLKVLPNFLWNLTNLEHVELVECQSLETLPDSLGNLTNLRNVSLVRCKNLESLRDSLGNLTNLQHVNLVGCESLKALPDSLGNLTNLQHVNLGGCKSLESLPDSFWNLTSLLHIDLRFCESLKILTNSFGNLTNLQLLAANGISLTPDFCYLPSLKYLLLRQFELKILPDFQGQISEPGDDGIECYYGVPDISYCIVEGSLCSLEHLRRINLCGYSLEVFPNFLWNLTNLQHLHLSGCKSLKTMPDSLGNLTKLHHVHITGCKSLKTMPDSLGNLTKLLHVYITGCKRLESLPDSLGNLTNLQHIDLAGCKSLESLPASFSNLTSLLYIDLRFCKSLKMLPNSFVNFTDLVSIDLSFCKSLEILPNSFGNLLQLEHLHLKGCSSLTISSETLGNMPKLKCLDLSGCLQMELLPLKIGRLLSLERLNLLGTNLKELPREVLSLSNLEVLRLGSPLLEVLPPLGWLTNLNKLWLRDCDKLRSLPGSVELLSKLTELKIWNCGIQQLPKAVMNMNNLKLLGIYECPLQVLPFKGHSSSVLFHLQRLELYHTRVSEVSFPRGVCPNLEDLSIVCCENLVEVGALPTTLENLHLACCGALRKIPGVYGAGKLKMVEIRKCYDIEVEDLRQLGALEPSCLVILRSQPAFLNEYTREWYDFLFPWQIWSWTPLDHSKVQQEVWKESFCNSQTPLDTDSEEEEVEVMLRHSEEYEEQLPIPRISIAYKEDFRVYKEHLCIRRFFENLSAFP